MLQVLRKTLPLFWCALLAMKCSTGYRNPSFSQTSVYPGSQAIWPEGAAPLYEAKRLWRKRTEGAITDLVFASDAKRVLVTTQPDPDIEGSFPKTAISLWNLQGKRLWRNPLTMGTKGIAISRDGQFIAAADYSDEVHAWSPTGKKRWQTDGTCRPTVLNARNEILCYHDDDAQPYLGFEGLDAQSGQKKYALPIQKDILALKLSAKQNYLAIALSGGQVEVFKWESAGPVLVWKGQAKGEVSDLDVSESGDLLVIASQLSLQFWNAHGQLVQTLALPTRVTQVGITPDARWAAVYGNTVGGQNIAVFSRTESTSVGSDSGLVWKNIWARSTPFAAEYHSQLQVFTDHLVLGVENLENGGRFAHLMAWDWQGKNLFDLRPETEPSAYLYTRAYVGDFRTVILGSDDGWMHAYRLERK